MVYEWKTLEFDLASRRKIWIAVSEFENTCMRKFDADRILSSTVFVECLWCRWLSSFCILLWLKGNFQGNSRSEINLEFFQSTYIVVFFSAVDWSRQTTRSLPIKERACCVMWPNNGCEGSYVPFTTQVLKKVSWTTEVDYRSMKH